MKLPESQGMWPAFWLLGNNIKTLSWPACGELDVMEHIDGNNPPPYVGGTPPGFDWIAGSVHGGTSANEANGTQQYHPNGFSAAAWHTYGMIWSKGQVEYLRGRSQQCVCDIYAGELSGHVAVRPGTAVHHSEPCGGRQLAGERGWDDGFSGGYAGGLREDLYELSGY